MLAALQVVAEPVRLEEVAEVGLLQEVVRRSPALGLALVNRPGKAATSSSNTMSTARDDEERPAAQVAPGVAPEAAGLSRRRPRGLAPVGAAARVARRQRRAVLVVLRHSGSSGPGPRRAGRRAGWRAGRRSRGPSRRRRRRRPRAGADRGVEPRCRRRCTLKMPSVMIAPPISAPRSVPRNVTTGISELRSRCTGDHAPARQPLGDRRAHVVGAQVLRDRGPGQPCDVGDRQRAEHERRQEQLAEVRRESWTVASTQPSRTPKHRLEDEAEDEDRHRDDEAA